MGWGKVTPCWSRCYGTCWVCCSPWEVQQGSRSCIHPSVLPPWGSSWRIPPPAVKQPSCSHFVPRSPSESSSESRSRSRSPSPGQEEKITFITSFGGSDEEAAAAQAGGVPGKAVSLGKPRSTQVHQGSAAAGHSASSRSVTPPSGSLSQTLTPETQQGLTAHLRDRPAPSVPPMGTKPSCPCLETLSSGSSWHPVLSSCHFVLSPAHRLAKRCVGWPVGGTLQETEQEACLGRRCLEGPE